MAHGTTCATEFLPNPVVWSKKQVATAKQTVKVSACDLFSGLSPSECDEILSCARARTFARDEMLFFQGQPVKTLVLIQSGSVKLSQISSAGHEAILWVYGSGATVGVHAETTACNHTCSAQAIEHCKSLVWEYGRLLMLGTQYPQITANLQKILTNRLHELERRFREIATEKAEKRLALTLLRLLDCVGKVSRDGLRVVVSREELAQMTGVTIFTVSRTLSRWAELGLLIPRREAIVVPDLHNLKLVIERDL